MNEIEASMSQRQRQRSHAVGFVSFVGIGANEGQLAIYIHGVESHLVKREILQKRCPCWVSMKDT